MAHAKWFASLPTDELTPLEHQLRKLLLKTMNQHDGPFPLGEWIDRRVGGEIETARDAHGNVEIFLRGTAPAKPNGRTELSKEAFFETLSPDGFAPTEEALREACFEFLASWRSPELATLRDLSSYPAVMRCAQQLLPRSVSVREWIQHRIGGEIEFRKGRGGGAGSEIVHLPDAARQTVAAKYQQIAASAMMPPPFMGHPAMRMAAGPPPPGPPPAGPKAGNPERDAFFDSLPSDELLPKELALRDALYEWFNAGNHLHDPPHLADAGSCAGVQKAKRELFPKNTKAVRLADWIERRIGGEIELISIGNGQFSFHLRAGGPPGEKKQKVQGTPEEKDAWFDALPQGEFSPEEEGLREALLHFLEGHAGPGPAILGDAASTQEVMDWRRKLLPKGAPVKLQEWIDRRIGGELETRAEGQGGRIAFGPRGNIPPPKADYGKRNDGGAAKRRKM